MAVTRPPGPVMDRDEVDRALARLGAEHKAVEDSLLALQDHAGRRLLEGAELTGVTEERWAATERTIALLWTYFDVYTDVLRAAREVRARHRWPGREELAELTERLCGESVAVPDAPVPGPSPEPSAAPAPPAPVERFTLDGLVARINELYARSLDVVVSADAVWSALQIGRAHV